MVTDIARPENTYTGDTWEETKPPDLEEAIGAYNDDPKRFISYCWGIYVTCYSRLRLFRAMMACGQRHYYYCDTDSLKIVLGDEMREFFEQENQRIIRQIEKALKYHGIDPAKARPKTIKGVEKPLGVFEYEGRYDRFKALRAKAYMTETNGELSITVAGVNKKEAVPYLIQTYPDPFEVFNDGLCVPEKFSGKLTHTYIDDESSGTVIDYLGQEGTFFEKSSIHMEQASYEMSLLQQYLDYIKGVQIEWKHRE